MENRSGSVTVRMSPFRRQNPQNNLNKERYDKELLTITESCSYWRLIVIRKFSRI